MTTTPESYDQRYTDYQTDRGWLRKWIRGFYLRSAAALLRGPTIDFGCGVGEFLKMLPSGSTGLEINEATVQYCVTRGLDVVHYNADDDQWAMSVLADRDGRYRSLVIAHVLEHLTDPVGSLNALLHGAGRMGVTKALVIVPGKKGYASDDTHLTFVDRAMLSRPEALAGTGFVLKDAHYFPGNVRSIGDVFPHHELRVVFERYDAAVPAL